MHAHSDVHNPGPEARNVSTPAFVPPADRPDRDAARTIAFHPGQGWSLLCDGVIVFDDTGELLPDGRAVPLYHPAHGHRRAVGLRG